LIFENGMNSLIIYWECLVF